MKHVKTITTLLILFTMAVPAMSQSIESAMSTAKSEGKKVLIIFYSHSDSWSQKLEKEVLTYQAALAEMSKLVVVKVDGDSQSKFQYEGNSINAKELAGMFSVTGYPSFVFLNPDGSVISFKYNGETVKSLSGYLDAADFVEMLKYFLSNRQTDTDLSTMFGN
jgi:thioredoxin-related protein